MEKCIYSSLELNGESSFRNPFCQYYLGPSPRPPILPVLTDQEATGSLETEGSLIHPQPASGQLGGLDLPVHASSPCFCP